MNSSNGIQESEVYTIGKPILAIISILQVMCILLFLLSPFIWIWGSWGDAWRLSLSGMVGVLITYCLYKFVKKVVREDLKKKMAKKQGKVTRFEVIDHTPDGGGRVFHHNHFKGVEFSYQDDGRTLKVFLKK